MTLRFPPWFRDVQVGVLGSKVPDVRGAQKTTNSFKGSWASKTEYALPPTAFASRGDFNLPPSGTSMDQKLASLTRRTLSARVRFLDISHTYAPTKRKRGEPETITITRTSKFIKSKFNQNAGAARFVYNQAIAYIRRQPKENQARLYNKAILYPLLISDMGSPENLKIRHPWLGDVSSSVVQQSLKSLEEAFKANIAAQRAARAKGQRARWFKMGFKKRTDPTAWTFTIPAQQIKAEHVYRPTNGPALQGKPQPQKARMWTKLTLPGPLFGLETRGRPGPSTFIPYVYLTSKIDITSDGQPLADMKFTRDRLGHWNAHWQRKALKIPKLRPPKTAAFLDPGSRTGNTAYMPGEVKSTNKTPAVVEYMSGAGGATKLFELCLKVDKIVTVSREIKPPRKKNSSPPPPLEPQLLREYNNLKTKEHRLRKYIYDLVRDGHIRTTADLFSKVDTVVVPIFDTHQMAKRPLSADDPRRKINNKTVRQLFSLRHGALRDRLRHAASTMGKEVSFPGEEYTTVTCPCCIRVNKKFSGTVFNCAFCPYTAPRDIKSGLTYAIKSLRAEVG